MGREVHLLATDPEQWRLIDAGEKCYEVRLDDRGYRVGDVLCLQSLTAGQAQELKNLRALRLAAGDGASLEPSLLARLEGLNEAPKLRATITSKVRLSGSILPPEGHWWQLNESMQHGIAVLGIEREVPSRAAAGSKSFSEMAGPPMEESR